MNRANANMTAKYSPDAALRRVFRRLRRLARFEFGRDEVLAGRVVVFDPQHVGFAADLAVLYVAMTTSGGRVDHRDIPLPARGALEAGFHELRITEHPSSGGPALCPYNGRA